MCVLKSEACVCVCVPSSKKRNGERKRHRKRIINRRVSSRKIEVFDPTRSYNNPALQGGNVDVMFSDTRLVLESECNEFYSVHEGGESLWDSSKHLLVMLSSFYCAFH